MILLEKLLILKSVTFFQQTPDDLLMQIIQSTAKETLVKAGELIVQKGEIGTSMYVIVNGRVQVHNKDKLVAELNEREVFGELAALSNEVRILSATALTDCLLLKISSEVLYDMMSLDVSLAKGIIKALCERTIFIFEELQKALALTSKQDKNEKV